MPEIKHPFFLMSNPIQDFAWGSYDSMQNLFGFKNPEHKPQAELWMGAHPNGCSGIVVKGIPTKLSDFIHTKPQSILGKRTADNFGELPYLFKVLAARTALSIQVHPSKQQAIDGFAKENQAGIALNASNRNYRDDNHKPELVYALTHYQAMNGFKQAHQIIDVFTSLDSKVTNGLLAAYVANQTEAGLQQFFVAMLALEGQQKQLALSDLLTYAQSRADNEVFELVSKLAQSYPNDIGAFSPLFLNVLTLKPGEAMYLDACTPHAYVEGTGLEIMANSDNVLRAGLTPKHIDINELSDCTRFAAIKDSDLLSTALVSEEGDLYPVPVPDFKFSVANLSECSVNVQSDCAQIVFCIDSECQLSTVDDQTLTLQAGQSAFIPAYVRKFAMTGKGRIARAYS
ncbi:mannose-6-phosphate isomerase, class I [Alginatibacterium sediminis]|uniref:mannose-6-phosphate isomerase n=1 Tax=Alginatibacterium sediminis TaxID=2164068 RepID=A0A420EHB6_9ALTE|nr:mannose-6-phosphate isomerase, class I [Alginatibacterium sediminis]RKF20073.1 mannose-6-phosphate isomerase, class I [Alginatibacterium sediminis]